MNALARPPRNAIRLGPRARRLIRSIARLVNPLVLRIAGRRHMPVLGIVRHRGRKTGRRYATPLGVRPAAAGGFVMPLTFGEEAGWYRNILATGWCVITWRGQDHPVSDPEIVDRAAALPAFPRYERLALRAIGINEFLWLRPAPGQPAQASMHACCQRSTSAWSTGPTSSPESDRITAGKRDPLSGSSAWSYYPPRVRIHGVFRGIGSLAVKFRWFVVVAWVIAAVAVPRALPSLSSVTQGNNANFLPASAPSEHALRLAGPLGGSTLTPVPVVAASTQGALTAADQAWLQKLQQDLNHVPTVVKVRDLGRSPDGQAAQLQVLSNVSQGGAGTGLTTLVKDLRNTISRDSPPPGLSVHLAGAVAIQVDQQGKSGSTDSQIQLLSIIFIIGLLLLVFRALLAPLVTLIPAFFAVTIAGPLVAEAAQHGLKVSPLAQILLIVLVLGAGTDYGLFLVFRVRENLRQGLERKQAVIAAVERVGESITFSAATVIAALLSLLFATFEFYSNLGIPLAIGIGVMLLAGLTLLPALLAIFGRAVFWPSKTQTGTGKTGVWGRVSSRIVRHPVPTLVAGLVVFGGLAIAASANTPAGFGGDTTAPAGTDSAAGANILAAHFPNTSANPTNIIYQLRQPAWDNLQALETARSQLEASGLFTSVAGPLNPNGAALTPAQLTALHDRLGPPQLLPAAPPPGSNIPPIAYQLYRATALYISPDGRTVQFETGLKAGDPSTTTAMNAIPAVRAKAAAVKQSIGAEDYGVGGEAPAIYDISSISNSDLATVIPIAIAVIGILLALVMRSLVAPLYLILSVGLSYFAALGLSVLLFIDVAGDGGLVFFLPFLMFVFLLALGEDYNILVMSRIREEAQHRPLKEAVSRALVATGTTVTSAGLVLGGTFGVFALVGAQQGSTQFRDVGAGLALGVLMDTFLVRTLLVPATVVLLGRWNWWPSKMSRPGLALEPRPPGGATDARDAQLDAQVRDPAGEH